MKNPELFIVIIWDFLLEVMVLIDYKHFMCLTHGYYPIRN